MLYRATLSVLTRAVARRGVRLLLLLVAGHAWAQPGTGGPAPVPAAVPLDGGATLLLATGAAYGLRRLRRATR